MRLSTFSTTSPSSTPLFLFLIMWGYFPHNALAQSSAVRPASSVAPISASAAASVAPSSTVPVLAFNTIPTLTACATARLSWTMSYSLPGNYNITMRLVNDGVDQTIPSSTPISSAAATSSTAAVPVSAAATTRPASSAAAAAAAATTPVSAAARNTTVQASKRAELVLAKRVEINQIIVSNQNAGVGYDWKVHVPQGRYFLYGSINDGKGTYAKSNIFTVLEGKDTSCLAIYSSASASAPGSATVPTGSSVDASVAAGESSNGTSTKGEIGAGAIAGIVVGVIAALVIAGLAFFCISRRRRQNESSRRGMENGSGPEMQSRNRSSSFGHTVAATVIPGGKNRHSRHATTSPGGGHIALTSMGGSSESHEKYGGSAGGTSLNSDGSTPTFLGTNTEYPDISPNPRSNPFATAPNTPQARDINTFPGTDYSAVGLGMASRADRRQSGPPDQSPTKTSSQGLERDSSFRSRSNSQPSNGQSGKVMGRTASQRRKPVPSLGAELRDEMQRQASTRSKSGRGKQEDENRTEMLRTSYQLMPDPPTQPRD